MARGSVTGWQYVNDEMAEFYKLTRNLLLIDTF